MKKHHSDKNYIFWPDLTRAPYSKEAVSSINKYVTYVPAHLNTSKVPQARLIERILGYLAQKVYERGWKATAEEELIRGIKSKKKDFDTNYLETLMAEVKAKVRSLVSILCLNN